MVVKIYKGDVIVLIAQIYLAHSENEISLLVSD